MIEEFAPGKPRFYEEDGRVYERVWRYDGKGEKLCVVCVRAAMTPKEFAARAASISPEPSFSSEGSVPPRVASTRQTALEKLRASGALSGQQQRVLDAMEAGKTYTRNELERDTGIRINAICGRVAELLEMGKIEECGARRCSVSKLQGTALRRKVQQASLLETA